MIRGTTPTVGFIFPFDLTTLAEIHIAFAQKRGLVIDKVIVNDGTLAGTTLSVPLTQDETLRLSPEVVRIQVRAKQVDGNVIASNILEAPVDAILKDGLI